MIEHQAAQMARKFEAEHGPESEQDAGWIYYADGARRELNPLGAYIDPPTDDKERCRVIAYYHTIVVARLLQAFDEAKHEATTLAKYPASGYDHKAATARLTTMRAEVQAARRTLAVAEDNERYARTGRTRDEEHRLQKMEAAQAAERERQRKELEGINV